MVLYHIFIDIEKVHLLKEIINEIIKEIKAAT